MRPDCYIARMLTQVLDAEDNALALTHARALLAALGATGDPAPPPVHPALAWRRAGLMAVTGRPDGPGLMVPAVPTAAADGALAALRVIAPSGTLPLDGALLLGERARLLGLRRQGSVSANGSCRLIEARDGMVAANLARRDDWDLVPAWLGTPASDWAAIKRAAAEIPCDPLVQRGRDLGLPLAASNLVPPPRVPFRIERIGGPRAAMSARPLVVDMSSLWAGPLAGALLHAAGADVVKVESTSRPDGARRGNPIFFDLMNAGKHALALDFADRNDLALLRRLIGRADIVIEASRPRALLQLGIDARAEAARGATWLSITAYGREGSAAEWIGFGDDVAVGAGLAATMENAWGEPLFAGDAIADPLTGITAAFAAWTGWCSGGGRIISVPMADVVAHALSLHVPHAAELRAWQDMAEADTAPLTPLRVPISPARPLGADVGLIERWI